MVHFLLAYVLCVAVIYATWTWVLIPYLDRRPPPAGRPWSIGKLPSAFAVAVVKIDDRPVDLLIVCAKHGGEDKKGYIRLFRCDTRQLLVEFPVPGLGNNMLAASRNGRYLAVTIAYGENNVRLYSLAELLKRRKGPEPHYRAIAIDKQPTCIAFSPDGRVLAIGTIEGTISIYNLEQQRGGSDAEHVRLWHDQEITALAFSPKDPAILVSGSAAGVTLWHSPDAWGHAKNAPPPQTTITRQTLWQPSEAVTTLAFNEDGILAATSQSTIRLMQPSAPQDTLDLSHPGSMALAFHGPILVSTGKDGKLWDFRREDSGRLLAVSLKNPPQALSLFLGTARFVAWTKHYTALLQVGLDDMAMERPLSALTHEALPEVAFDPADNREGWSPTSMPAIPQIADAPPPPLPIPQGVTRVSDAPTRPPRERRPMSPLQKMGVPVALCSAFLPTFGVYLLNRLFPPAPVSRPAAKVDFSELSALVQDIRNSVQKAESSEKAGHKALAKTQWTQIQVLVSTIDADDHPSWFQKARQEQQVVAAAPSPQPGPQNEALNDIAESRLDLAKAEVHLNALASARKAITEIEHSYSQAQITEPDGDVLPALEAVQKDLPDLQKKAGRRRPEPRGHAASTHKTS